jgi:hypothetical protein
MVIMNPGPDILGPMRYKPVEYTERPEITTPGNELREVYTDEGDRITVTWVEFTPEPEPGPSYEEQVVALIRERYSADDELALLRQRDTKPEEFEQYFNYCEECKATVKQKLGMV